MDIINFGAELIASLFKHGWSVTTIVVSVTALLRVNTVRRMLLKRLPKRFRTEDRLERLELKVDAISAKLGVKGWDAAEITSSKGIIRMEKSSLLSRCMTWFRAVIAGPRITDPHITNRNTATKLYSLMGRNKSMKNKLLSRKFILAVVGAALIIANDGLDLGIDQQTVLAFAGLLATFIVGESAVDAKRAGGNNAGTPSDTDHAV